MTTTQLLKHFTKQNIQLKLDIREILQDSNIGIHAKIIDEVEKVEVKIDAVLDHQTRQNNMLQKHEDALRAVEKNHIKISTLQETCPAIQIIRSWKTLIPLLFISIIGVNWAYNNISWDKAVDILKSIF